MPVLEWEKNDIDEYAITGYDGRKATIRLINGKFSECKYVGLSPQYNLEDWKFLHEVSRKVLELVTPKTKENIDDTEGKKD